MRYLSLAEALVIAEAVTGIDSSTLAKGPRVGLLDSALHAPRASFAGDEFYPDFVDKRVELGVHPRVMQGRAGHATARMTMELYAHVPEEADRRTAEALDLHYRGSQNRAEPVRRRRSR